MRAAPRPTPDDLDQQYARLLAEGIKHHADYVRWLGQIDDWERGGKKDIAAGLRAELVEHETAIVDALRTRTQLLRQMDRLSKMDAVIGGPQAVAAGAVASILDRAGDNVADENDAAFFAARTSLAESMGYTIDEDDGDWLTVSRNGVVLEMKLSRAPTPYGVTGDDRIEALHVSAEVDGSTRTVSEYRRSEHAFLPSASAHVQAEIDRAVAVFG